MTHQSNGFSLVELLIALLITLGSGMAVFQLFQQNERIFRDQNLIIEMQQNTRAVTAQIADEIRMAGQGMPIYAATFDSGTSEAATAIMQSSTASRIDFRAGLSNVETNVTSSPPVDFTLGTSKTISVGAGSVFSTTLGTTTPAGKFVYIWGPTGSSTWGWIRAELTNITSSTLTVTPREGGNVGFIQSPTVSLEEAISFQFSDNTIKRATATNTANPASPTWSAANEIGRNFVSLTFRYYDRNNRVVTTSSLAERASIARVNISVAAQPSDFLSDGTRPSYSLSLRTIPRNLRIR